MKLHWHYSLSITFTLLYACMRALSMKQQNETMHGSALFQSSTKWSFWKHKLNVEYASDICMSPVTIRFELYLAVYGRVCVKLCNPDLLINMRGGLLL
jgi:hypothetical protein